MPDLQDEIANVHNAASVTMQKEVAPALFSFIAICLSISRLRVVFPLKHMNFFLLTSVPREVISQRIGRVYSFHVLPDSVTKMQHYETG